MSISAIYLKFFHRNIIPMTCICTVSFVSWIKYKFTVVIWVYCDLPWKIGRLKIFTIVNFGHPVFRSWLEFLPVSIQIISAPLGWLNWLSGSWSGRLLSCNDWLDLCWHWRRWPLGLSYDSTLFRRRCHQRRQVVSCTWWRLWHCLGRNDWLHFSRYWRWCFLASFS